MEKYTMPAENYRFGIVGRKEQGANEEDFLEGAIVVPHNEIHQYLDEEPRLVSVIDTFSLYADGLFHVNVVVETIGPQPGECLPAKVWFDTLGRAEALATRLHRDGADQDTILAAVRKLAAEIVAEWHDQQEPN